MCGIAGAFAFATDSRISEPRLAAARDRMAHRGPDGEGLWCAPDGRVGLVHRRLSVIDVELGQQPLVTGDDAFVIVFNGEVYNYRELRAELEAEGARFRTNSDTEVVLEAFRARGPRCIDDFRGMFAFAIWDRARHRLCLARDRTGQKPLFWAVEAGVFYFASTLDALRALDPTPRDLDLGAVDDLLTLSYIPAPHTIWQGVEKLPAAHEIEVDGSGPRIRRYWDIASERTPFEGSHADAVDRLDELVHEAVALRLRSDVPLGVFLSGGIDSSLVAAVANQHARSVQTFAIGFDVPDFDESPHASAVARHIGTEHRTFDARLQILDLVPEVVDLYGEPFGDSSALNVWQLSRLTRQHVTVALGGDGGDEGFFGYDWYRRALQIHGVRRRLPSRLARWSGRALALAPFDGRPIARARRALRLVGSTHAEQFALQRTFIGPDEVEGLYRGALREARVRAVETAHRRLSRLYEESPGSDLNRMRCVDIESYLADCLLPKVDVASMAHGLEARAPLLDHRILEFATTLPDRWSTYGRTGKLLLRDVLERYVPRSLFERRKAGFSLPLRTWFATSERERLERIARDSPIMDAGWFDRAGLVKLIAEHASGARDHSDRLYNIVALDAWLRARQ